MVYIEVLILDIYYVRVQLKYKAKSEYIFIFIFTAIFTVYILQKNNKFKLKIKNKIIKIY